MQSLLRAAPVSLEGLRMDGLLAQAIEANGDPMTLAKLFGLTFETAIRYCNRVGLSHARDAALTPSAEPQ